MKLPKRLFVTIPFILLPFAFIGYKMVGKSSGLAKIADPSEFVSRTKFENQASTPTPDSLNVDEKSSLNHQKEKTEDLVPKDVKGIGINLESKKIVTSNSLLKKAAIGMFQTRILQDYKEELNGLGYSPEMIERIVDLLSQRDQDVMAKSLLLLDKNCPRKIAQKYLKILKILNLIQRRIFRLCLLMNPKRKSFIFGRTQK